MLQRKIQNNEAAVYIILSLMLLLCISLLSHKLYVLKAEKVSNIKTNLQTVCDQVETTELKSPLFFVKLQSGVVRVEDCRNTQNSFLLNNIDVRTMRNVDRFRFESGFYVYSQEELSKLLEDYGS